MNKKPMLIAAAALILALSAALFANGQAPVLAEAQTPERNAEAAGAKLPDNTVVMYVGNPKAFINGEETPIIKEEPTATPFIKNGSAYVPLRFTAEAFGVETQWKPETRTAELSIGNETLASASGEMRGGRLYVPIRYVAEALGKEVFYERGLIVISKDALSTDKDEAEELIALFTGLEKVGTKERLIELMDLNEPQYDVATNDGVFVFPEVAREAESGMAGGASAATPAPQAAPSAEMKQESAVVAADDAVAAAPAYSETNVQVEGIDEADIIKTDGEYIYYVRGGKIEIVKAGAGGKLEHMSQITMDVNASEIFIDKNRIIAIGQNMPTYKDIMPLARNSVAADIAYPSVSRELTKAVVYDTTDKKNPKEEREIEVRGYYNSARKIGNSVYFVASYYVYYYMLDDITPTFRDSAVGAGEVEIGFDRVYCFPVIVNNSITSVVGFNIDKPEKAANIETFAGAGGNLYMSENALYIANSRYDRTATQTDIYKFMISNAEIVYSSSGNVPGNIINQFSMDEHNGYFRIGTTVDSYGTRSSFRSNSLYVLDSALKIVGKVENIAPEERIYSVRFMGNRAYMVTFKQVDPLFAIDVSDPRNPEIMGALKIPGYSDYLHPYDENHLIGFGKDTTLDKYGNAFYLGMKLSLFDVSDISNPREMFTEYIGGRGTESPILSDHKALLFSKERELLAFPVNLYEVKNGGNKELEYGEYAGSYAYVYSLNLKDGFKLRGRLTHLSESDMLKASAWGGDYEKYIERILYIGKQLYTASQAMIMSSDYDTFKENGRLEFK